LRITPLPIRKGLAPALSLTRKTPLRRNGTIRKTIVGVAISRLHPVCLVRTKTAIPHASFAAKGEGLMPSSQNRENLLPGNEQKKTY
jgi:hypothetical protein